MAEEAKANEAEKEIAYSEEEEDGGIFKWMSALVVMMAVSGFFGLAWYAYKSGGEAVDDKDVELVKADQAPVKEAPANPGGMAIPNQDKTVYGLIGNGKTEKPMVEHILAPPETPMARDGETETWMSDNAKNKEASAEPQKNAPSSDSKAIMAQATPEPAPQSGDNRAGDKQVADASSLSPAAMAAMSPAATTVSEVPTPPTPAPIKPKAAPAAPASPAAASAAPAGERVQLGAYKSEKEAEDNWGRIGKKFSKQIGDKEHVIVRAEVPGKGTFYRLQIAAFDSAKKAEAFCSNLTAKGQGCFPVKAK